jgi:demethylmacrocin O-methyltransferase
MQKGLSGRTRLKSKILSAGKGRDLNKLGHIYGTDKVNGHFYAPHYMTHLSRFRLKRIKLLEIGVGGDADPLFGGHSLRMWKRYFPFGKITGVDIHDKSVMEERRIKIFQGDQVDEPFLNEVERLAGPFDIIIDDGSHINEHVIETFRILFPKLKDGGIYVVEDTQTSYWEEYGGDSVNLQNPKTMMNFFKSLVDCLNHTEFVLPGYERSYYDRKIVSMHFYHNMVFICKGDNNEPSNIVVDNKMS